MNLVTGRMPNEIEHLPFLVIIQEVKNVLYGVYNVSGGFYKDPTEAMRQVAWWFSTDTKELKRCSWCAS